LIHEKIEVYGESLMKGVEYIGFESQNSCLMVLFEWFEKSTEANED
jgi:hypothetical protein